MAEGRAVASTSEEGNHPTSSREGRPLYAETSAILAWLLGEPKGTRVKALLDDALHVVTATLTSIETLRALHRAVAEERIDSATCRRLEGRYQRAVAQWTLLELSDSVRTRASAPFPIEPVRSFDAIHLASALEALLLLPDLGVLSLDQRVIANLEPLGLPSAIEYGPLPA